MRKRHRSPYTTRGKLFLAAGWVGLLTGAVLGNPAMLSIGALLICLPNFSYLAAVRSRFRLGCMRWVIPARVTAGQSATVMLRLHNAKPTQTSLLLAEDEIPFSLGDPRRFVVNGIERDGHRDLRYEVRSDQRGRFTIGPLRVRIADVFGLVELSASFANTGTLTVTPKVVPLSGSTATGSWSSEGANRTRMATAAGEDDVIPRAYQQGDELRRVHWRSTARYGELMVRREEQHWQDRAVILLDTRASAHAGSGAGSSFEYAVSAAASVGVHLARAGLDARLVTDAGPIAAGAAFEDALLDTLAVMTPSRSAGPAAAADGLKAGLDALGELRGSAVILIAGRLTTAEATQVAALTRDGRPGIAFLLAASTWVRRPDSEPTGGDEARTPDAAGASAPAMAGAEPGRFGPRPGEPSEPSEPSAPGAAGALRAPERFAETDPASAILASAGWRVISAGARTPFATAWQLVTGPDARFGWPGSAAAASERVARAGTVAG